MPAPAQPTASPQTRIRSAYWLFLLLAAALFADEILLGPYAVVGFHDTMDVELPHFLNQARFLLEHGPFAWYPNSCGGLPSFAGQHPPYALPGLLLLVMPMWLLSLVWYLAQVSLTGFGMYRLLKDFGPTSDKTAFLGGTLYSASLAGGIYHIVFAYLLPIFAVWTADLARGGLSPGRRALRAAGLALIAFISYPVLSLPHGPIFHLGLVLALCLGLKNQGRMILAVFMVWTGYVLIFTPTIYTLFEYIPFAQRDWDFAWTGLGPALLDFGDLCLGKLRSDPMLPLVLLGLPLVKGSKKLRLALLFWVLPVVISCLFTSDFKALFQGSFLLKMDLFLFSTVSGVGSCLFSFMALEQRLALGRPLKPAWVIAIFILMAAMRPEQVAVRNVFFLATALAMLWIWRRGNGRALSKRALTRALAGFAFCLAAAIMMVKQDFMASDPWVPYAKGFGNHAGLEKLAREPGPFRVGCVDLHPVIAQSYGLDTLGQKGPLFNKYYKQYMKKVVAPQLANPRTEKWFDEWWHYLFFTRRTDAKHFFFPLTLKTEGPRSARDWNLPMLKALNVRFLIASRPIQGIEEIAGLWAFDPGRGLPLECLRQTDLDRLYRLPIWIYELKGPMDRGWLAGQARVFPTRQALLEAMAEQDETGMREQVFLLEDEADRAWLGTGTNDPGRARLTGYSPDRLVFEAQTQGPCFLVVANNWDPYWRAEINGRESRVIRADNAFQAVRIEGPGEFEIVFKYSRPVLWWLHLATLAGICLMGCTVFLDQGPAFGPRPEAPNPGPGPRVSAMFGGSLLAAALWAAQFYIFVVVKNVEPGRPLAYVLAAIPCIGVLSGLWAALACSKRLLPGPDRDRP
ncbi:MAG: hypothetical protein JW718_08920 [Desulfovibrionaceae bacterium]|nr:hypothetical protein [Desulfovibrionaceae bacterium]